jgi:hypothetical protein
MPIHIGQLISNVTINPPTGSEGRPTPPSPTLDLVLRQPSQESAPAILPAAVAGSASNPASSPPVDPEALADRVYRLLIDEAVIARERA